MNEPDDLFDDYIEGENGLESIALDDDNIMLLAAEEDGELTAPLMDTSLVKKMSARRRIEDLQDARRLQQELEYLN